MKAVISLSSVACRDFLVSRPCRCFSAAMFCCRGFGTVRFTTVEAAQKATETMNNVEIEGRQVTVRQDRFG